MITYIADYPTPAGPARRVFRCIRPYNASAALRAVERRLAELGIEGATISRVPGLTPIVELEAERFTIEYLHDGLH